MANLKLVSPGGTAYNFPQSFWLDDMGYNTTINVKNIPFASGGKNISDGYLRSRTVTISGDLRADSLPALEILEREFHKAVLRCGKLYVSDDSVSRYITVCNPQVDYSYIGTYRLERPVTIAFNADYPYWEDDSETQDINILAGDNEFTIDNSDSDFLVFPTITIEANQGAALPNIRMINKSDGAMKFEYNDPNFSIGDILIINCKNGTVKRNNINTIEYFLPARFFRLQNIMNTISYEGNACTITFSYRTIYL